MLKWHIQKYADPLVHSIWSWLETEMYWIRIAVGSDVCHWGCASTVLQTGVSPAVYGTVYNKEPLKSFDKSSTESRLRASFCRDIAMLVQKAT